MDDEDDAGALGRDLPAPGDGGAGEVLFQHTVMAQCGLPYRDPGDGVRVWDRTNGRARLRIQAGAIFQDDADDWKDIGLPFGPKPRLILAHLNAEALRTRSPTIRIEDTLTAFVRRLGLCLDGRSIRVVRDQLARLAAAEIRLAVAYGEREARQVQAHLIGDFMLWLPSRPRERVPWLSTVTLDPRYFASLQTYAVPLHEHALAALAHNAMALDVYAWLAQRLHRVDRRRPAFVPWKALKDQFGQGYDRMDDFKRVFRRTLSQVLAHYQGAQIEGDDRGLTLRNSPPPVLCRLSPVILGPSPPE